MKNILFILGMFVYVFSNAQIVTIPDSNFKNKLLTANGLNLIARDTNYDWMTIDINNDGEIQESEAENVAYLYITEANITSLDGIDKFINLLYVDCRYNNLTVVDFSLNLDLEILYVSNNNLTNLNIANNIALTELFCSENGNGFTNLDVVNNIDLQKLHCNMNALTNLSLATNTLLKNLDCSNNNLNSLNVDSNILLTNLNSSNNSNIGSLDVTNLPDLVTLNCENNSITNLNINNNIELRYLTCGANSLMNIDFLSNIHLIKLDVSESVNLNEIDLSSNPELNQLKCSNSTILSYINLKNGNNDNFVYGVFSEFSELGNNLIVCVDELNSDLSIFIQNEVVEPVVFSTYCSFSSAQSNEINGDVKFDYNTDGCDVSDISVPNKMITSTNGTDSFATFTQNNGNYKLYTYDGEFNTSTTALSYNTIMPNSISTTFVGFDNEFTADFCIAPNQNESDVNISIIPLNNARPGLLAKYKIIYENTGNTTLTGSLSMNFDDTMLSFQLANPTETSSSSNTLIFNYIDLNPYETRIIDVEFNVFAPPTVNLNDVLSFTLNIDPIAGDYSPANNIYNYNQIVVDSYDPNDIHILEGTQISFSKKDMFLHYVVRFQNTGSADAINVVVKNTLDDKLDWSTLKLQTTSHQSRVAIKNGNEVEFIFENINLPDETTNEPNSHGFIAYKIKAKQDIIVEEIIPNKAGIFFDLNTVVETNIASTKFVNTLAVSKNSIFNFTIYPSPTKDILNIESKNTIEAIEIFNHLGQLVIENTNQNVINVSNLKTGFYFVKIKDENGNYGVKKIIKQ